LKAIWNQLVSSEKIFNFKMN